MQSVKHLYGILNFSLYFTYIYIFGSFSHLKTSKFLQLALLDLLASNK